MSAAPSTAMGPDSRVLRARRPGVSAEAVTAERLRNWKPKVIPKTAEERRRILDGVYKLDILFGHLNATDKNAVIDAMFYVHVPAGESIIKQGDEGDNFYIVDSGLFDIFVARAPDSEPKRVCSATAGISFGELALMYNSPRAATVTAVEDSWLWGLDREAFQMMLITTENIKKKTYEEFLERIELFRGLNKYERAQLSDMLVAHTYRPGEAICVQGGVGDRFYIIETGEAECTLQDELSGNELTVCEYSRGSYFGELALLGRGVRQASVYAIGLCVCLSIDKETFERVLGPIIDILRKNADMYPTYKDMITQKEIHESANNSARVVDRVA